MNFSNIFIIKAFYNVKHLVMTVFPAFRISVRFMIGTEPAIINAFICGFNMKIMVEINKIAIMPASDNTCKQTKKCKISFFKKE